MFAPGRGGRRFHHDDIDFKLNQLDSENGKSIQLFRNPSVRNANVLPFYIAQLPQGGFENFVKILAPIGPRDIQCGELFSPAAPWLPLPQQAAPRRPGLIRPQLSSLHTLFVRISITYAAVAKSVI